jgi:elongator complex protein 3
LEKAELFIDEYNDIGATEYFLSYCSPCKKHLYGFLRLRINDSINENVVYSDFGDIDDYAFVRELHVYGLLVKHDKKTNDQSYQHKGIGTLLLKKAEEICLEKRIYHVAIISGVGVRGFYKKKGYSLKNNYMIKNLNDKCWYDLENILLLSLCLLIVSIMYDLNFD